MTIIYDNMLSNGCSLAGERDGDRNAFLGQGDAPSPMSSYRRCFEYYSFISPIPLLFPSCRPADYCQYHVAASSILLLGDCCYLYP